MTHTRPRPSSRAPRGAAMLLVLVALMSATVLATAFLASRDNSSLIGDNIARSTSARWVAMSGVDLGVAILQTDSEWRTSHANGRLVSGLALGEGLVDLDLVDRLTGGPPDERTDEVAITATATVAGVSQVATATVRVLGDLDKSLVDVDLSEFAIYAGTELKMKDDTTVMRWPAAPASGLGRRVVLGTRGTAAGTLDLQNQAAIVDATLYHGPGASGSLVLNTESPALDQVALLDQMPMPAAPDPGVPGPGGAGAAEVLSLTSDALTVTADTRWDDLILNGSTLTLVGDLEIVVEDDASVTFGSTIVVDGQVKMVVFDLFNLYASAVELTAGSSLEMWVGDKLYLTDGYIGDDRAGSGLLDTSGAAVWSHPERARIYALTDQNADWTLRGSSVVKGVLYGPNRKVILQGSSALYGCVAADRVELQEGTAVYYDHALDAFGGLSALAGPAYGADGRVLEPIRTLASLNATDLDAAAAATGRMLTVGNHEYGAGSAALLATAPGPADPTPRPVLVEVELTGLGYTVAQLEVGLE